MPIYEYQCESCQQSLELLIRGQETPECTECGSTKLTKMLSVPAAHSGSPNGSSNLPVMPMGGG